MPFISPMGWPLTESLEHNEKECYGCKNFESGLTKEKGKYKKYVAVGESTLPVPFVEGMVAPKKPSPDVFSTTSSFGQAGISPDIGSLYQPPTTSRAKPSKQPEPLTQKEIGFITADMTLPKNKSEKLTSFLKRKNLLAQASMQPVAESAESSPK